MFKKIKIDFLDKVIIKRTNRKKTISISVTGGNIIVISPKLVSKSYLNNLLEKKQKWINKKLEEDILKSNIKKRNFSTGEFFFKFGKKKTLVYEKSSLNKVVETKNIIRVYCLAEKDIKRKLESWYKEILNSYVEKKLEVFKKLMDVDYSGVSIKLYKNRLGACTHSGKLSFNWKIVMMPHDIINYIIIHELSHLKHFNHSKKFWKYVENFCPNYKEKENWLKENKNLIIW